MTNWKWKKCFNMERIANAESTLRKQLESAMKCINYAMLVVTSSSDNTHFINKELHRSISFASYWVIKQLLFRLRLQSNQSNRQQKILSHKIFGTLSVYKQRTVLSNFQKSIHLVVFMNRNGMKRVSHVHRWSCSRRRN